VTAGRRQEAHREPAEHQAGHERHRDRAEHQQYLPGGAGSRAGELAVVRHRVQGGRDVPQAEQCRAGHAPAARAPQPHGRPQQDAAECEFLRDRGQQHDRDPQFVQEPAAGDVRARIVQEPARRRDQRGRQQDQQDDPGRRRTVNQA